MVKPSDILAVIPARGGSKSIPRKNIKLLGGVPLIAYSIAAGLHAETVGRVIVSTEDEEIARIAQQFGAEVPFLRPAELSHDETLDLPVFIHALQWLGDNENYRPEIVVQLRPTSPFRPVGLIDQAVHVRLEHADADSVRGIVPAGQNPYKMWRLTPSGAMKPLLQDDLQESYNMPRQLLPPIFWQTGHIDAIRAMTILGKNSMSGERIYPVLIDPAFQVDIDSPLDWERAEWILERARVEIIRPAHITPTAWQRIQMLVLDFDGVLTDNRVLTDQHGNEAVWCDRGDGWGIARLKDAKMPIFVLSTELNPVVAARCRKLGIPCVQGSNHKLSALKELSHKFGVPPNQIAYVGNDVNDLECLRWVGLPIAVADAAPVVKQSASYVTRARGGHGAVRQVCDLILTHIQRSSHEQSG